MRSAGAARLLPLAGQIGDYGLMVEGYTPPPDQREGRWQIVTDDYLETVGERLCAAARSGRPTRPRRSSSRW